MSLLMNDAINQNEAVKTVSYQLMNPALSFADRDKMIQDYIAMNNAFIEKAESLVNSPEGFKEFSSMCDEEFKRLNIA